MITLEELIIEMMPFREELVAWCRIHPEFLAALKNVYPKKFISPGMIMVSYPITGDEILGIYTYHYGKRNPIFKQDFIVDVKGLHQEFILYTRNPNGSNQYVKDINEFFQKFEQYGYTKDVHHLTLQQLPEQLQERAVETIKLAFKLQSGIPQEIPQSLIDKIYKEVMAIKKENRYYIEKLK